MISPSVFIFNLVVSKLKVMKFSKNFEIYFFRLTLKEPNSPDFVCLGQFYSNKEQRFPIFFKYFCSNSANIRVLIYSQHSIMEAKYSQNISNARNI
jgi:hypothetical protein